MRYSLALAGFLVVLMSTYYVPQFAEAQTLDRETCDEDVCYVKITRDGFVPKTLTVKIGTTVVWTNEDTGRHTVTSGSPGEEALPLNSGLLEKDDSYEFNFYIGGLYKGTYKYFDQVTKTMRAEIIVEPEPEDIEEEPVPETINIDFSDPTSGVKKISLSNGNVMIVEADPDTLRLMITVQTVDVNGKLQITLDRNLIDAKADGKDEGFIVIVDGEEGFHEEISSTPTERTLEIVVPRQTTEIEIVGTQVVPEFPLAMLVIAAIFGSMIATYRLRTSFRQIQ